MYYDVFGPSWSRELERLFDEVGSHYGSASRRSADGTALNVWANDEAIAVTAEVPGVDPTGVNLSIVGDTLTIAGSRRATISEAKGAVWHRREREAHEFSRTIQLPFRVDPDRAEARVADGVLTIALRRLDADKPRTIAVNAA